MKGLVLQYLKLIFLFFIFVGMFDLNWVERIK